MTNNELHNDEYREADWEKHLNTIIEQTTNNINYLSRSVKTPLNDPLPHPIRLKQRAKDGRSPSAPIPAPPNFKSSTALCSREMNTIDRPNFSVGVTRPLSKQIEDDINYRIGHIVKTSVARAMTEKSDICENRVDRLADQLDNISDDTLKVHKEYTILSRSVASHDRLVKRLKEEWEKQRFILKQIEGEILNNVGWIESMKLDLHALKDQQIQDTATRLSNKDLKDAMGSTMSKMMVALDRAKIAWKNSLEADLSMIKENMDDIKEQNHVFRQNFDEVHMKKIISSAVESLFKKVEMKISSNAKKVVDTGIKTSEEKILDRVKSILNKEKLEEKYKTNFNSMPSDTEFKNHLNSLLGSEFSEFKDGLLRDVTKRMEEIGRKSSEERDMMQLMIEKDLKIADPTEDLKILQNKLNDLEQQMRDNHNNNKEINIFRESIENSFNEYYSNNEDRLRMSEEKMTHALEVMDARCTHVEEKSRNFVLNADILSKADSDEEKKEISSFLTNLLNQCGIDEGIAKKKGGAISAHKECSSNNGKIISNEQLLQELDSMREKTHEVEGGIQAFQRSMSRRMDLLEDRMTTTLAKVEHEISTQTKSIQNELDKMKADTSKINKIEDRAHLSFTDLVSCHGKVSALENSINIDISELRREFIKLQDTTIDLNATSHDRINTLAQEVRGALLSSSSKADFESKRKEVILTPRKENKDMGCCVTKDQINIEFNKLNVDDEDKITSQTKGDASGVKGSQQAQLKTREKEIDKPQKVLLNEDIASETSTSQLKGYDSDVEVNQQEQLKTREKKTYEPQTVLLSRDNEAEMSTSQPNKQTNTLGFKDGHQEQLMCMGRGTDEPQTDLLSKDNDTEMSTSQTSKNDLSNLKDRQEQLPSIGREIGSTLVLDLDPFSKITISKSVEGPIKNYTKIENNLRILDSLDTTDNANSVGTAPSEADSISECISSFDQSFDKTSCEAMNVSNDVSFRSIASDADHSEEKSASYDSSFESEVDLCANR